MFPDPVIQQKKLSVLGLAGALGNVLGLLLAGVCMLANYRYVEVFQLSCNSYQMVLPSRRYHCDRE